MMLAPLLAMLAAAAPIAPRPDVASETPLHLRPVERRIEVGGQPYRVVTAGEMVAISGGDPAAPLTYGTAQLRKAAAARVTGCVVRREYWDGRVLRGLIDCSARVLP